MTTESPPPELVEHLMRFGSFDRAGAVRLIQEVLAFYDESVDDYVRRRHLELQAQGVGNAEIYTTLQSEIGARPFPAQPLSTRQIRRIIYG